MDKLENLLNDWTEANTYLNDKLNKIFENLDERLKALEPSTTALSDEDEAEK